MMFLSFLKNMLLPCCNRLRRGREGETGLVAIGGNFPAFSRFAENFNPPPID
jgi:hypothetical protein